MKPRILMLSLALGAAAALWLFFLIQAVHAGPIISVFYTMGVKPGLQLIATPLDNGQDNRVQTVFPSVPDGTSIYQFTNTAFTTNLFVGGAWDYPEQVLAPGEGAFIFNPNPSTIAVTFAGHVLQGQLTNTIPAGLSLKGSMTVMTGGVTTDLSLHLAPFDNLYQWQTNHFVVYTVLPGGEWYPSEPKIGISESFFVNSANGTNWVQTFNWVQTYQR